MTKETEEGITEGLTIMKPIDKVNIKELNERLLKGLNKESHNPMYIICVSFDKDNNATCTAGGTCNGEQMMSVVTHHAPGLLLRTIKTMNEQIEKIKKDLE